MRTSILAALMAATVLIPGAAMAQRGDDNGDGGRWQGRQQERGDGGQARPQFRPQQQDQTQRQAPPQTEQQAPPQRSGDREGWIGRNGGRGDFRDNAATADVGIRAGRERAASGIVAVAPQPQPQPQAGNRANGGMPGNRGDWRQSEGRGDFDRAQNRGGNGNASRNDDRGRDWSNNGNRGGEWHRDDDRGGNWNRGGQHYGNRSAWSRNWRQDNRYDWNQRRQYNRNAYHLPRYYAPYGWNNGYRRFGIGFTLSAILFNQNYWISDPIYYGLPDAYGPYRWVRYYNDALLVDIYTGQVVDTVYDIFW